MTKPMLIEALNPGMRARLSDGRHVIRYDDVLQIDETSEDICSPSILTATDYEIIDDLMPWELTAKDGGYLVDPIFALRTQEAAEETERELKLTTALRNMPGYKVKGRKKDWIVSANGACTFVFDQISFEGRGFPFEFCYSNREQAEAAAELANRLKDEIWPKPSKIRSGD